VDLLFPAALPENVSVMFTGNIKLIFVWFTKPFGVLISGCF
jgi:hypothetical protein